MQPETDFVDSYRGKRSLLRELREAGDELFPTEASLEWFCRHYRQALVESGQFIIRRGNRGNLYGPRFKEAALRIMRDRSMDYASRSSDSVAL